MGLKSIAAIVLICTVRASFNDQTSCFPIAGSRNFGLSTSSRLELVAILGSKDRAFALLDEMKKLGHVKPDEVKDVKLKGSVRLSLRLVQIPIVGA